MCRIFFAVVVFYALDAAGVCVCFFCIRFDARVGFIRAEGKGLILIDGVLFRVNKFMDVYESVRSLKYWGLFIVFF